MIGEIEKGISTSVIRRPRPGKRNRATTQATAIPKAIFTGTTTRVTITVSQIACSVSGVVIAAQ